MAANTNWFRVRGFIVFFLPLPLFQIVQDSFLNYLGNSLTFLTQVDDETVGLQKAPT
jgi:hypothetical protein